MADQGTEGLLSPFLQSRRLGAALPYLRGRVLDIGCGNGALANACHQADYYGFDVDKENVTRARSAHPGYRFEGHLPEAGAVFDTVVALAVVEHLADPATQLRSWGEYLQVAGRMVLTTPLPALGWIHDLGARVGVFSRAAAEEHERLIGRATLEKMLKGSDLRIELYKLFLGGANQLFVLSRG
jgi:2-polyprenyl-3-methyl-5-hydroxy-6-metoxy-1,4-benzoquinol methylase